MKTTGPNRIKMTGALMAAAPFALLALPGHATDLKFSNETGSTVTLYGQVNLTFQSVNDGVETYDFFVDNSNSTSRVGLWIDSNIDATKFRFNFETALGIENTAETFQDDDASWLDWQKTDIRKLEVTASGSYGAFWLGQGSMATDGAAEIDNSGTSVVGYVNLADTAGAFLLRDGDELSDVTIGSVFKDFDGPRRFRVRYDTPDFSGFKFSAAAGKDVLSEGDDAQYYDTALRYGLDNDTVSVDAAIGYSWKDDEGTMTEQAIASVSATHVPTGLNLTMATGRQVTGGGQYFYTKLGWTGDLVAVGETSLSADFYTGNDFGVNGSNSDAWGVQAVQQFAQYGVEAYLGYREYSYDGVAGADYRDLDALLVGARWKF